MEMMPSGLYNTTYQQDMSIFRTKYHWAWFFGFLIFLFLCPFFISNYVASIFNATGIAIIASLGVQVVLGYCGQITLGQAAFLGVGAYSWTLLAVKLHFPPLLAIPAAGLITAVIGVVFAIPSARIKGFYLAVSTLAAHIIIIHCITHLTSLTGGATNGLMGPVVRIGGISLISDRQKLYFIMPIVVIMVYLVTNLIRTRFGRAFIAIRDNDLAAEVMGINVFLYKVIAFAICSFCAGVAGSLWAISSRLIHPEQFTLMDSIWYIAIIIIGGMGSIMGIIFGTVSMQLLREFIIIFAPFLSKWVPSMSEALSAAFTAFLFGFIIAIFLIFEPRGLNHRWVILKIKYRLWPFPH